MHQNKVGDAIKIFKLNTTAYPNSPNVFDSLGEAYLKANDNISAYFTTDALKDYIS